MHAISHPTTDVLESPFLHVSLVQRLHRCKGILRFSKGREFRPEYFSRIRAPLYTESMRVREETSLLYLEALQCQQD